VRRCLLTGLPGAQTGNPTTSSPALPARLWQRGADVKSDWQRAILTRRGQKPEMDRSYPNRLLNRL
jgi:hypothetical protein